MPTTPATPATPTTPSTPSMPCKTMNPPTKKKVSFLEAENRVVSADSSAPRPVRQLWLADKPDVVIEMTEHVDEIKQKHEIYVSLATLMRVSAAFRYHLKCDNMDGHVLSRGPQGWIRLRLTRDDPTCMRILCRLGHDRYYRVVAHPRVSLLARLARMAHKYQCISLIKEYARVPLNENRIAMAAGQGNMDILTIAYLLRDEAIFETVTREIVLNFTGDIGETFGKEIVPGMAPHKCILETLFIERAKIYDKLFRHLRDILSHKKTCCKNERCPREAKETFKAECQKIGVNLSTDPAKPTESVKTILKKMEGFQWPLPRRSVRHEAFNPCANIHCSKAGSGAVMFYLLHQTMSFIMELNRLRGLCMTCCLSAGYVERREGSCTKPCKIHG